MVVGHQDFQAQRLRRRHPLDTGDAVVHRDQDLCAAVMHPLGNAGRQAIAIDHAVWDDEAHMLRPQQSQTTQGHRASRGTVAVVIGDDADAFLLCDGISQQLRSLVHAFHAIRWQQMLQLVVEFLRVLHTTPGIQTGQQWMDTGLFQGPDRAGWGVAGQEFHDNTSCKAAWGHRFFNP